MNPPATFVHSLQLENRSCVDDKCVLNFRLNGKYELDNTLYGVFKFKHIFLIIFIEIVN